MPERRWRHTCQNGGWCGYCEFLINEAEARRDETVSDADMAEWETKEGWNNIDDLRGA